MDKLNETLLSEQISASFSHQWKNGDGEPTFQWQIHFVYITICYKSGLTVGIFVFPIF